MILSENKAAVSVRTELCEEAQFLVQAFFLALESDGGHYRIAYAVVKDFATASDIECLDVYTACKSFLGVLPRWQPKKLK